LASYTLAANLRFAAGLASSACIPQADEPDHCRLSSRDEWLLFAAGRVIEVRSKGPEASPIVIARFGRHQADWAVQWTLMD
jgi:hypothetical protein